MTRIPFFEAQAAGAMSPAQDRSCKEGQLVSDSDLCMRRQGGFASRLRGLLALGLLLLIASPGPGQEASEFIPQLVQDLEHGSPQARREAAYRLHLLGKEALPALPVLIKALGDSEQQVWFHAVMTISEIGPEAAGAVSVLVEGLNRSVRARRGYSRQVWYRSAFALSRIGRAALPALREALSHPEASVRAGAAKALGWIGPDANEEIPLLVNHLPDPDATVREESALALGLIGAAAKPVLLEALGAPEAAVRRGAAIGLSEMGRNASEAGPALIRAWVQENEPGVRAPLLVALRRVGLPARELVPVLVEGLKDVNETVRHEAINGWLMLAPPETVTVPALLVLLGQSDPVLQERAAYVLGRLGPPAAEAVPHLVEALERAVAPVDDSTYGRALREIGPAAVPGLIQALTNPAPSVRLFACDLLGDLGHEAREAVPALRQCEQDSDNAVRRQATESIRRIEKGD